MDVTRDLLGSMAATVTAAWSITMLNVLELILIEKRERVTLVVEFLVTCLTLSLSADAFGIHGAMSSILAILLSDILIGISIARNTANRK